MPLGLSPLHGWNIADTAYNHCKQTDWLLLWLDRVLRFLSIAVFFFKLNKRQNHQYASVWEYQLTLYSRYILNVTCRNLSWYVEFIYFIIKFHTIQHLAHRACKRRSRTFGWYCTLRIYQQTNHYSRFSIPFSVTKFSHMKKGQ